MLAQSELNKGVVRDLHIGTVGMCNRQNYQKQNRRSQYSTQKYNKAAQFYKQPIIGFHQLLLYLS